MSIKIASCEDNQTIINLLASYFKKMIDENNVDITVDFFNNGEQLLGKQKMEYDIYLLDIDMGDNNLDGMEIAYLIRQKDQRALIIFLTSVTRCLKEGYKVNAYRYLTKPISYKEFKLEILEAIKDVHVNDSNFINLLGSYSRYNKVDINDIYYIETNGRKSLIHTKNGNIDCIDSITTLSEKLKGKNFYRCHSSYIINVEYVSYFDNRVVKVNNSAILVSRSKAKGLKELLEKLSKSSVYSLK